MSKELEQLAVEKFGLQRFAGSDSDIQFYTGFPDYNTLTSFYEFLEPAVTQLNYWGSRSGFSEERPLGIEERGPSRKLKPIDELFLVLYLGDRFGLHPSSVSRILTTWINFLYHTLKQLPIWASHEAVTKTMPACFMAHYPRTCVIIYCTELFIQMPSSFRAQSQSYSTYKRHNTAKGLVGIAPNGFVTFISRLYGGHISDKAMIQDCGLIDLLEPGDVVMADKGFDIQHLLAPKKEILNIPPFMGRKEQLTLQEEADTQRIASVCIHVERAIERIKNYRVLQGVIPISIHAQLDQIWFICCMFTTFLRPLVE